MKRLGVFLAGAALSVAIMPALAAGSWVAETRLTPIARRGVTHVSPALSPRATTPLAGRAITRVHWRYGYDRPVWPRPVARLCMPQRCIEASRARGFSDAFAGAPVATVFKLHWRVPGQGREFPVRRGGHLQLVVDFR